MFVTLRKFHLGCTKLRVVRKYDTLIPWIDFPHHKPGILNSKSVVSVVNSIVDNEVDEKYLPADWERSNVQYLTSPKRLIVEVVSSDVSHLWANEFVGHSGCSSRLVYGEKGIGKSSALRLAVMGTWLCFDNVIPIYLEYVGSFKNSLVKEVLNLPDDTSLDECLKELRRRNQYALIIADEIEQVYAGLDFPEKRRLVLDDLAVLGSQRSGRVYTYICGSSSLAPLLISKNAVHDEDLRKEFPFVSHAPNLNRSKYSGFCVHRGLQGIEGLNLLKSVYKLNDEAANLVYYLCGSNLRSVDSVVREMKSIVRKDEGADGVMKSIVESVIIHQWDQNKGKTFNKDGPLIHDLLDKMVEVNLSVVEQATENFSNVSNINWFRDVTALRYDEVMKVCDKHGIENRENAVNLLIDKGFFSGPPDLQYLYPNKPSELVSHHQYTKIRKSLERQESIKIAAGKIPEVFEK